MDADLRQSRRLALSIGVGGIVGGGFFATFGITVAGAKGATPISFLLARAIAALPIRRDG